MERILSYEKIDAYLANLSALNVDIKDYCGTDPDELADKMDSIAGLDTPALIFFNYQCRLEGPQQRTFNVRTISFSIIIKGVQSDDYVGKKVATGKAEKIGLEVLSRINVDSKRTVINWLYTNFIKESVRMEEIESQGSDGYIGMEFSFDLKVQEPLIVNPDRWTDGADFCEG